MRGVTRLLCVGLVLAWHLSAAGGETLLRASQTSARARGAGHRVAVPVGTFLAADMSGRVFILSRYGRLLRRVPGSLRASVQGLVSPDRRRAYVSTYARNGGVRLYDLDLTTGRKRLLGWAFGPALNPARTTLAYVRIAFRSGLPFERALVTDNLRTHRVRSIAFPPDVVVNTPPELVLNWSPNGRHIAVFDGGHIRLVDVATALNVQSQPRIPEPPERLGHPPFLAPVYLNTHELVVDTNCCERSQHLATIDLHSGARRPFASLSSPPQNIRLVAPDTLLVEDAVDELALVSRERVHIIATHIAAAAP